MSIIIKGMEMPENETSYVECQIWGDGTVYKRRGLAGKLEQIGTAVPLPEKHGRLIDADALAKRFEHLISLDWNQKAAPYSWAYAYSEAQAEVDDAPTIVPAEGGNE